jgi:tRNA threonylcarbamoyladenosine biosynthesis protein TsaB
MSLLLCLETSTDVCSVALFDNQKLLQAEEVHEPQAHASRLAPLINDLLKRSKIDSRQLGAIAITSGPGSYTGLRIGASTAKGLCLALDIPLIAIPTLDVLAYQGRAGTNKNNNVLLCPMIDARRMEVYCQVYNYELNVVIPVEPKVIGENSFQELLDGHSMFFMGNGSGKCKDVLKHPNAFFIDDIFPKASILGEMAAKKYAEKKFEDLINFTPFYLKEFVAKKGASLI